MMPREYEMSRSDILRSRIEQCRKLAGALPAGTVKRELEKLANQYERELEVIRSKGCGRKGERD
jgi:hypothetical protein